MKVSYKSQLIWLLDRKLNKKYPTIADNVMDEEHQVIAKELAFKVDKFWNPPAPEEVVQVIVHAMKQFGARRMLRVPPSAGDMGAMKSISHGRRCSLLFQEVYDPAVKAVRKSITFLLEVPK